MSYTYTTYKAAIATEVASTAPDLDFDAIFPSAIDYVEQRIYRELNLLSTVVVDVTTTLTQGSRVATIPNTFVAVDNMNVISPPGASPSTGSRRPLVPVSRAVLDMLWPDVAPANQATPTMFSMVTQWSIIVGPPPDGPYVLEVIGTTRPAPISVSNPTTFLSDRLPDLLFAGTMIFFSMYMRNFAAAGGQAGSDPMMSGNWEAQYELLKASADTEEARKRFWASSWSSQPVSPAAQPQRG